MPAQVRSMYEENLKTAGGQAKNTDLINSAVMRRDTGGYGHDLKNPFVTDRLALTIVIHVYVYTYKYIYIYTYIYIYVYIPIKKHTHIYICTYICMYIYMHNIV